MHLNVGQNLEMLGWVEYLKVVGVAYECLIKEFYSNANIIGLGKFKTFVRGRKFQVNIAIIVDLIKLIRRELDA